MSFFSGGLPISSWSAPEKKKQFRLSRKSRMVRTGILLSNPGAHRASPKQPRRFPIVPLERPSCKVLPREVSNSSVRKGSPVNCFPEEVSNSFVGKRFFRDSFLALYTRLRRHRGRIDRTSLPDAVGADVSPSCLGKKIGGCY